MNSLNTTPLQAGAPETGAATPHYWIPPGETRASREPSLRSRGSARGTLIGGREPRAIVFESTLEEKTALVLLARPDVVEIEDQPEAVTYVDSQGVEHEHTFDFRAELSNGSKVAISVKPKERAERKNLAGTLQLMANQIPTSFANQVLLVTEEQLPSDLVANARLIHAVRRDEARSHDQAVRAFVAGLNGRAGIDGIVRATGLGADAFRALVRLIADGVVRVHTSGRIDYDTLVSPSGAATGNAGEQQ